jgi:ketosteroid isomerase-like protein
MSGVLEELLDAMNAHDAERFASFFAEDYQSAQPIHASRAFGGRAQVLANWTSVFDGVPDFAATLISSSQAESEQGIALWGEWDWHGRYADGSPFAMRGVTILVVRDDLVAEGRLYMEPVANDGEDIDEAVQELYKPPSAT